ncbi:Ras family protein [Histomonas meleagridis]|uniref:Ras family protein n=1 Tax=Histomonas meleagridis TaxID=135588 RepID=UPI003559B95A|nr:Ras family protein [Histomonas meleagridis]KAH0800617.1 Ras family protein [Histomonas meleagridis]
MGDEAPKFKVVFVGDTTVGKTSIIQKYLNINQTITSTLGATSTRIDANFNDFDMIMNVWDTAGQDSFRNLVPVYAKGSHAVVIVFDVSNKSTYDHLNDWYNYLTQHVQHFKCVVVANKIDKNCEINFEDAYSWASEHNAELIKTSAVDGTNIEAVFETISKLLYERFHEKNDVETTEKGEEKKEKEPDATKEVDINQKEKEKKGGCSC